MSDNSQGDLSPMLPQPSDDNAPMISGHGTKIIVSARGAYMAGNLEVLIQRMDQMQQQQYHAAIIRQGLYFLQLVIDQRPQLASENTWGQAEYRQGVAVIQMVEEWLTHPTQGIADTIIDLLVASGLLRRFELPDDDFAYLTNAPDDEFHENGILTRAIMCLVPALRTGSVISAGEHIIEISQWVDHSMSTRRRIWTTRRWQIEAAWHILQRRSLPALGGFSAQDRNADGVYRSGDLFALYRMMTPEQQSEFKRQVVWQALELVEHDSQTQTLSTKEQTCLQRVRSWVNSPSEHLWTALKKARDDIEWERRSVWLLASGVVAMHIERTIDLTMQIVEMLTTRLSAVNWWHVELVWALLQGENIPTFPRIEDEHWRRTHAVRPRRGRPLQR